MIPNFEPDLILPRLASLVRPGDLLLLSANLAPGDDYRKGVRQILPLYDNELTRDWLMSFLTDLGIEKRDGQIRFTIQGGAGDSELERVAAYYTFEAACELEVDREKFAFRPGGSILLFFSYRHTPRLMRDLLGKHRLQVLDEWITRSQEEGVFLVTRS